MNLTKKKLYIMFKFYKLNKLLLIIIICIEGKYITVNYIKIDK